MESVFLSPLFLLRISSLISVVLVQFSFFSKYCNLVSQRIVSISHILGMEVFQTRFSGIRAKVSLRFSLWKRSKDVSNRGKMGHTFLWLNLTIRLEAGTIFSQSTNNFLADIERIATNHQVRLLLERIFFYDTALFEVDSLLQVNTMTFQVSDTVTLREDIRLQVDSILFQEAHNTVALQDDFML